MLPSLLLCFGVYTLSVCGNAQGRVGLAWDCSPFPSLFLSPRAVCLYSAPEAEFPGGVEEKKSYLEEGRARL